jgi:hypothetical protein
MLGDHPVRPFFMKTSDKRLYVDPRHFADYRRAAFGSAPVSGRRAQGRRLPGHAFWVPGWLHRFRRRYSSTLCGRLPRTATPRFVSSGQPAIMSGVFGRAPVPEARPQSREDLSTGRSRRRRRRRWRWRAGPGCRVSVTAESGIGTIRTPSPHRGGSHRSRPGHGGRQSASRCTLETGEGSDGRRPHRRRGTARRHAADLG